MCTACRGAPVRGGQGRLATPSRATDRVLRTSWSNGGGSSWRLWPSLGVVTRGRGGDLWALEVTFLSDQVGFTLKNAVIGFGTSSEKPGGGVASQVMVDHAFLHGSTMKQVQREPKQMVFSSTTQFG